jgi:hypothetical protein
VTSAAVSRWCRILLCAAAALACARPAAAEWQYAPFFGWEFGGHTSFSDLEQASDDTHRAFGITVRRLGGGTFGFEATVLFVPGFFNDPKRLGNDPTHPENADLITSSRAVALMGNLVVTPPRRWNEYGLRPYISGGLGLLHAYASDELGAVPLSQRLFGANVGGGAVGFLTERTGLRFDLRFFTNVRNEIDTEGTTVPPGTPKHLRYWVGSIGLVLR